MTDAAPNLLVVHTGALGDNVLIWPLLRALAAHLDRPVRLVADGPKAALARRVFGDRLAIEDAESAAWSSLWRPGPLRPLPDGTVGRVFTNLLGPETDDSPAQRTWRSNAREKFPNAQLVPLGAPGDADRAAVWLTCRVPELGSVERRKNPRGPIVIHVGAGGRDKTLPLPFWGDLARLFTASGLSRTDFIAGEVEQARFTPLDHQNFARIGGRWLRTLDDLHDAIIDSRLFIGADTGPTHLAAQLGLPTLAVFGPTDPAVWAPVGAPGAVRVVRAPAGVLADLAPAVVERAACELLR